MKIIKVIITKYAVTSGVKVMEGIIQNDPPTMIKTREMFGYYHGNDWHSDKTLAKTEVRLKFARKRASLNKQLDALAGRERRAIEVIEKAEL